jgi:ubiquinone/menaquinone biosynthesis C-methylase UbiE
MTQLASLLDDSKIVGKRDGIYLTDIDVRNEVQVSRTAWESIYNLDLDEFEAERSRHGEKKLDDHLRMIERYHTIQRDDVYLEIGCGPAYVAERLMKDFGVGFIGIDFNLKILDTLRRYLDKSGLTNHLLIHADINTMPLRDGCVDLIFGGGVIEHFADTARILSESRRALKDGGASFNTVPAFNLSWLPLRFYNNVPAFHWLRPAFTRLHTQVFRNRLFERNFGYELSFTLGGLRDLHRRAGFENVSVGPLGFHPSPARVKSRFLQELYFFVSGRRFVAPIYYVAASK